MLRTLFTILALSLSTPAFAQAINDADRSAITALSTGFGAAMNAGDYQSVIGAVPPKIIENIATSNNMTTDALRTMMVQQTAQVMQSVTLREFSMDTAQMTPAQTSTGRSYVLVPTRTVVVLPDTTAMEITSSTLFLKDDDSWFMVRIEDPSQVAILTQVYPDFAGIAFAPGAMKQVQ